MCSIYSQYFEISGFGILSGLDYISSRSATAEFLCKCILHSKSEGPLFVFFYASEKFNEFGCRCNIKHSYLPSASKQRSSHHQALFGVLLPYHLLALSRDHGCLCILTGPVTLCNLLLGLCRPNKEFLRKFFIHVHVQIPTKLFRTPKSRKTASALTRSVARN